MSVGSSACVYMCVCVYVCVCVCVCVRACVRTYMYVVTHCSLSRMWVPDFHMNIEGSSAFCVPPLLLPTYTVITQQSTT